MISCSNDRLTSKPNMNGLSLPSGFISVAFVLFCFVVVFAMIIIVLEILFVHILCARLHVKFTC